MATRTQTTSNGNSEKLFFTKLEAQGSRLTRSSYKLLFRQLIEMSKETWPRFTRRFRDRFRRRRVVTSDEPSLDIDAA